MEVKINKKIKEYNGTMFFGLSVRQFIFALLACGAAVGICFGYACSCRYGETFGPGCLKNAGYLIAE